MDASLTLTKLAGNQPSSSSTCPHHQSLLEASRTLMMSPALNANSRSAMVTWSHTASALMMEPPLISWRTANQRPISLILMFCWSQEKHYVYGYTFLNNLFYDVMIYSTKWWLYTSVKESWNISIAPRRFTILFISKSSRTHTCILMKRIYPFPLAIQPPYLC